MLKNKDMYIDYKKSKRVDHQRRGNKSWKKYMLVIGLILTLFAFLGGGYLIVQGKFPITLSDISFKLKNKADIDISEDKSNLNLLKHQYAEDGLTED